MQIILALATIHFNKDGSSYLTIYYGVEKQSCLEEREAALRQNIQDPNGGTYITSCTTEGLWSRIQCHNASGFCWCVNQSTGIPISGTAILKKIPDCNAVKVQRQMKGTEFIKMNIRI